MPKGLGDEFGQGFMQRVLITAGCLLMLAWLALTGSGKGIVVWQSKPYVAQGHSRPAIRCTYFDGTRIFERGFLYTPGGGLGYSRCPILAEEMF